MINIKINDLNLNVHSGISILEACKFAGITIPRFCYHETLSIAGNCRMCLVELEGLEKPVASCLTEISEGISIYTDSIFVKKARENVVETLLLNHPLDCPICDQAGECDLQDQAKNFGSDYSRYFFNKRGVEDKDCGPLIKTIMTRCIHCTRCVRFGSEVAGIDFLGTLNRGSSTEIGSYVSKFFDSEISGNVIDLCPVGALTSKPYGFKARPWELRVSETIDFTDSTGSNLYVNFKESNIYRVLPRSNKGINEHIISDKTRFSYDGNSNNRVRHIFGFNKNKHRSINWTKLFKQLDTIVSDKKSHINVTINDDIGFDTIELLKKISRINKNITISSLKSKIYKNNFYLFGLHDTISSIDTCNSAGFIFSLNPKIECSVINTRLRTIYRNSLLFLVNFAQMYSYNIPTKFVNLNLSKSLSILEGKYNYLSSLLLFAEKPLILSSDFFGRRGQKIIDISFFFKQYFDTIKIIKINETPNSESLDLSNIKNSLKKNLNDKNSLFCLNSDDTYDFRKNFYFLKHHTILFNTHGSKYSSKVKLVIPILSELEESRIILNTEQRPQISEAISTSYYESRSIFVLIKSIFEKSYAIIKNPLVFYSAYLYEMVNNPSLFDNLERIYCVLCFNNKIFNSEISYLYMYPIKANIGDFYCSNKTTRNSKVMQQSSQYLRKLTYNFI